MKPIKIKIENWIEQRMKGIGGSDAAAVLNCSPWKTRYQLWLEKTGQFNPKVEQTEIMAFGHKLEQVIADEFESQSGFKVRRCNFILQNPDYPFMIGNIDREGTDADGRRFVLECKNVGTWAANGWKTKSDIPTHHLIQVLHYIIVGGYDYGVLAGLIGGNHYEQRVIMPDQELIDIIVEAERLFWDDVETRREPQILSPGDTDTMDLLYPVGNAGETIQDASDIAQLVRDRQTLKINMKSLEDRLDAMDAQIKQRLGTAERADCDEFKITWKNIETRRIDSKAVQAKYPDVYAECSTVGQSRRFEIKLAK